jgi:hypothetical protein
MKKLNNYRISVYNKLKNNDLKNNNNEKDFNKFILSRNLIPLKLWLNICSAKNDFKNNIKKLDKILDLFKKTNNIIFFKDLFKMDSDWYLYYNVNADINGNLINDETRLGVDRDYVIDITLIQNKIHLSLDNAIIFYITLKSILFLKIHS